MIRCDECQHHSDQAEYGWLPRPEKGCPDTGDQAVGSAGIPTRMHGTLTSTRAIGESLISAMQRAARTTLDRTPDEQRDDSADDGPDQA